MQLRRSGVGGIALALGVALLVFAGLVAQRVSAAPTCTITWDGEAGTTAWATGLNWDANVVPAPTDVVCVPNLGGAIDVIHSTGATTIASLQGTGGVQISGGTLDVTDTADPIAALLISGGSLGGPGTVRIGAFGAWSGGTMTGAGQTTVDPGATLVLAADATLGSRTINVDGVLEIPADNSLLAASAGPKGLLHVRSTGFLVKTGGSGGSVIEPPIDNDGDVRLNGAGPTTSLSLAGGSGTAISTGSFGQNGPGNVRFSAGAHTIGPAGFDGGVQLSGADITIPGGTTLTSAATEMSAGTLSGAGELRLTFGGFTWSGGTMTGAGQTTVDPGATLVLAADATLGSRTINVDGVLEIPADNSLLAASAGPKGLLHVRSTGFLVKTGGSGGSVIEPPIDNDGDVRLNGAGPTTSLSLAGGSGTAISTGSFGQNGPGHVRFSAGAHTIGPAGFDGGVQLSGADITIPGGTTLTSAATEMSAGTLSGAGELRLTFGGFTWSGGTMTGAGQTTVDPGATLVLAADATLGSRTINVDGVLEIPADNSLLAASAGPKGLLHVRSTGFLVKTGGSGGSVIEPPIDNDGDVRLNGAGPTTSLSLAGGSGTAISTGSFGQNGPGNVRFSAGAHTIGPAGFDGGVQLSGADITIPGGTTLTSAATFTQTAGITTVEAGATLGGPGSTFALQQGVLRGTGTAGGDVVNDGGIVRPGTSTGILTIGGDYTQNATGTLETEIAGLAPGSGYDRLAVGGTATLAGALDLSVEGPFDPPRSSTYDVLTASTRVGAFDAVGGPDLPGRHYEVEYPSSGARLRVAGDVPLLPANSVAPSIPTSAETGDALTCDPGQWANAPTSFAYDWLRDGAPIPGAASQTYTIANKDVGHALRCTVVATNGQGSGEPAFSNTTRPSAPPPPQTLITGGPRKRTFNRSPSFGFTSDDPLATFLCKLDRRDWRPCSSPSRLPRLRAGKHVFQVRAISAKGTEDESPAARRFAVVRARGR